MNCFLVHWGQKYLKGEGTGEWCLAENQGNHQNFVQSFDWFSWGWSIFFNLQNGWIKKTEFFKIANFQNVFAKISEIGPWVSRIDWCEVHWCGSTYIVVRLSNISSKTGKKWFYGVFRLFLHLCRTVLQPYRLSHVNFLCMN